VLPLGLLATLALFAAVILVAGWVGTRPGVTPGPDRGAPAGTAGGSCGAPCLPGTASVPFGQPA
jgi:hypothetical protein